MRILVLGGTTEATALAERLAGASGIAATLSLAGRTRQPVLPPIPCRIGGFGGVEGLVRYLAAEGIELVVDATHPFAEQMSAHAVAACAAAGVRLLRFTRPPWQKQQGDRWMEVPDAASAAAALGPAPRRVFLAVGRLQLPAFERAPQHDYLIRTIEPPEPPLTLPRHRLLLARGPFDEAAETALLERERIEVVVAKNSGGAATYGKLAAARRLGLPVILLLPPASAPALHRLDEVMARIAAHRALP